MSHVVPTPPSCHPMLMPLLPSRVLFSGRAREGTGGGRAPGQRRPHRSQTAARGGSCRAPALEAPPRASGTGYGAPPCICPRTPGPCLCQCLSVSTPLRTRWLACCKPATLILTFLADKHRATHDRHMIDTRAATCATYATFVSMCTRAARYASRMCVSHVRQKGKG